MSVALAFAACLLADDARAIPEFESRHIETRAVATAPDALFETFLDRLMQVESEYIRERMQDLEDVSNRLLEVLSGKSAEAVAQAARESLAG